MEETKWKIIKQTRQLKRNKKLMSQDVPKRQAKRLSDTAVGTRASQ